MPVTAPSPRHLNCPHDGRPHRPKLPRRGGRGRRPLRRRGMSLSSDPVPHMQLRVWMTPWPYSMGRASWQALTPMAHLQAPGRCNGWPLEGHQQKSCEGCKAASGYALHSFAALAIQSIKSGQSTCYQTGQFYLLPTFLETARIALQCAPQNVWPPCHRAGAGRRRLAGRRVRRCRPVCYQFNS